MQYFAVTRESQCAFYLRCNGDPFRNAIPTKQCNQIRNTSAMSQISGYSHQNVWLQQEKTLKDIVVNLKVLQYYFETGFFLQFGRGAGGNF